MIPVEMYAYVTLILSIDQLLTTLEEKVFALKQMLQDQERKTQIFHSRVGWLCAFLLLFCLGVLL